MPEGGTGVVKNRSLVRAEEGNRDEIVALVVILFTARLGRAKCRFARRVVQLPANEAAKLIVEVALLCGPRFRIDRGARRIDVLHQGQVPSGIKDHSNAHEFKATAMDHGGTFASTRSSITEPSTGYCQRYSCTPQLLPTRSPFAFSNTSRS